MVNEAVVAGVVGFVVFLVVALSFRIGSAMNYAYSNARARVMLSHLLPKQKVESYCEMNFAEIVSDLEAGSYKDLILTMGDDFSLENIQHALNIKSSALNKKLLHIVPKKESSFFKHLLSVVDFNNVRVLLRLKFAGKFGRENVKLLTSTDVFAEKYFDDFIACSLEEFKVKLRFTQFKDFAEKYLDGSLVDAERALDVEFFGKLLSLARKSMNDTLVKFARQLIDLQNVKTLSVRSVSDLESGKFIHGGYFDGKVLLEFKSSKDLSGVASSTYLGGSEVKSFVDLRLLCERHLVSEARNLLMRDPLSVNSTLAFFVLKDFEVQNLKRILKLKAGKVDSNVIRGVVV